MEIQSLSIVVPTKGCVCKCKTCVSRIHCTEEKYQNNIEEVVDEKTWHFKEEYRKRLEFARDNGCNTMVLTGAPGEPLQNLEFLKKLTSWNYSLRKPFYWIELQTTGVLLTPETLNELKVMGISTISLSVFDVFNSVNNMDVIGVPKKLQFDLDALCHQIKEHGFNLRICLNLMKWYDDTLANGMMFHSIFDRLTELGADQVTFRKLYTTDVECTINEYIKANALKEETFKHFNDMIKALGTPLEILPFGARKYSYRGISSVVDDDCMSERIDSVLRYLILRENCRLYTKWADTGSLVF